MTTRFKKYSNICKKVLAETVPLRKISTVEK